MKVEMNIHKPETGTINLQINEIGKIYSLATKENIRKGHAKIIIKVLFDE